MNDQELERLDKALPKDFRLRWVPADLEGPAGLVFDKPDHYLIVRASKKGFLGLFRHWQTIGFIRQYWPADVDNVVFLRNEHYSPYFSFVAKALTKARVNRKTWIVPVKLRDNVADHQDLKGLYIPEQGEIVHWGKGHAIVTLSPLTNYSLARLNVISLNAVYAGREVGLVPIEVGAYLVMGPYEPIPPESQPEVVEYYNTNFNGAFAWLFQKRPEVKEVWQKYKESKGL